MESQRLKAEHTGRHGSASWESALLSGFCIVFELLFNMLFSSLSVLRYRWMSHL